MTPSAIPSELATRTARDLFGALARRPPVGVEFAILRELRRRRISRRLPLTAACSGCGGSREAVEYRMCSSCRGDAKQRTQAYRDRKAGAS